MTPVKVAILTSFPEDPSAPRGGVEAVSVNLTRALAAFEDLEIHVVTTDRTRVAVTQSTWERVVIHRLPSLGRHVLSGAVGPNRRQIQEYVRRLAPDIVHAHDTYGLMVKGLDLPRVFTIHGFIYADTLVSGGRLAWVRSRIWRWVERAAWADQPHIISISPYVRERLAGIARGVIHDIDNPIAESFFGLARNERKPIVFSAAVICPRKNTLRLIDAFARLVGLGVDAQLRLAGTVEDPRYGARVGDRIRSLGLAERVVLLDGIGTDQVCRELAAASVFALVSLEENSPLGIQEAMAAGVPVVASNRCGMPYLVRDGESGFLVDPHDPQDIASRLGQLLGDAGLRRAMGERSQQIARERFHPQAVARRTRDVYLRALRDAPSRARAT